MNHIQVKYVENGESFLLNLETSKIYKCVNCNLKIDQYYNEAINHYK